MSICEQKLNLCITLFKYCRIHTAPNTVFVSLSASLRVYGYLKGLFNVETVVTFYLFCRIRIWYLLFFIPFRDKSISCIQWRIQTSRYNRMRCLSEKSLTRIKVNRSQIFDFVIKINVVFSSSFPQLCAWFRISNTDCWFNLFDFVFFHLEK